MNTSIMHIPDKEECRHLMAQIQREKQDGTYEKKQLVRELHVLERDWQMLKAECDDIQAQIQQKRNEITVLFRFHVGQG